MKILFLLLFLIPTLALCQNEGCPQSASIAKLEHIVVNRAVSDSGVKKIDKVEKNKKRNLALMYLIIGCLAIAIGIGLQYLSILVGNTLKIKLVLEMIGIIVLCVGIVSLISSLIKWVAFYFKKRPYYDP